MMNGTQTQYSGESSGSTSLSSQQDIEDDRMIALVLSEEYAKLDGGVGRRLSKLEPVAVRIPDFYYSTNYNKNVGVGAVMLIGKEKYSKLMLILNL